MIDPCCLRRVEWTAPTKGHETVFEGHNTYVVGSNADTGILIIHNLHGWTFPNTRILADHIAAEVGATVYIPDFFGGEVLPADIVSDVKRWGEIDIPGFAKRNSPTTRNDEVFDFARKMKTAHKYTAAIGICFGGWGVVRIAAKGQHLVDCISTPHPTFLTKDEISNIGVPVQIHAPEHDQQFTWELKEHCNKVIPTLGIPYDFQFYPGLEHGFAVRGETEAELKAVTRVKDSTILWLRQHLPGKA